MDCGDKATRKISEKEFLSAETYEDFLQKWAKFYENKICIPTYSDVFVGGSDNPLATELIGQKFRKIIESGIIPYDSQLNDAGSQKGYIDFFCHKLLADAITVYINRYPGMIAFNQEIDERFQIIFRNLYVTYHGDEEEEAKSIKSGILLGRPSSRLGYNGYDYYDMIRDWLSKPVKRAFNSRNMSHVTIIDAVFTEYPDRILDILLLALEYNGGIVDLTLGIMNNISGKETKD